MKIIPEMANDLPLWARELGCTVEWLKQGSCHQGLYVTLPSEKYTAGTLLASCYSDSTGKRYYELAACAAAYSGAFTRVNGTVFARFLLRPGLTVKLMNGNSYIYASSSEHSVLVARIINTDDGVICEVHRSLTRGLLDGKGEKENKTERV